MTWTKITLVVALAAGALHAQQAAEPAHISGRVLDTASRPLAAVRVSLTAASPAISFLPVLPSQRPAPVMTANTAADGAFVFQGVSPGKYQIAAQGSGYLPQAYGGAPGGGEGSPVAVQAGQKIDSITLTLTSAGTISGAVSDESGKPYPNVTISILRRGFVRGKPGYVDVHPSGSVKQGNFSYSGLAPGQYYVMAFPQPHTLPPAPGARPKSDEPSMGYVPTYYPSATELAAAAPIQLFAGSEQVADIKLAIAPTVRIRGRIDGTDFAKRQGESPRVMLMSPMAIFPGQHVISATPGEDGAFEFSGVAPGDYLLLTLLMNTRLRSGVHGAEFYSWEPLTVGNRNIDGLKIVPHPKFQVTGSVKLQDNRPDVVNSSPGPALDQLRLGLQSQFANGWANARLNADGTFLLDGLAADKYQLRFSAPPGTYISSIRLGGHDVTPEDIDLSAGAAGSLDISLKTTPARVDGVVRTKKEEAAPGAVMSLIPADPSAVSLYRRARADQNGGFTLENVPPGKYTLYAWEALEPDAEYDPEVVKAHDYGAVALDLQDSASTQAILTVIAK